MVYNNKDHKVYAIGNCGSGILYVWDFASDIPRKDRSILIPTFGEVITTIRLRSWIQIATTVPGKIMYVDFVSDPKTWQFHIYKLNPLTRRWVKIDSLGDAAIILDLGFTVVAKDIPGIKKNSIYFSGLNRK